MTNSCILIDDDTDDQEIFIMALKKIDRYINCIMANDWIEGLQRLTEDLSFVPGYIFIDINMPKMDGIECLVEIRKLNHLQHAKIIMYSTTEDPIIIDKSKELGATAFLVKPPGMKALIRSLTHIFLS